MSKHKSMEDFVAAAKSQIQEIEITEVDELISQGYQVLDVREPDEFAAGTIKGAVNVPRGFLEVAADLEMQGREEMQDRDKKWLLLCGSSGRSALATATLQEMGFNKVKNINGGIQAWEEAKMEINTPS